MGTYPVPTGRFRVIFPYSVERDRAAWRWSWGAYAEAPGPGRLTTSEVRKLTGKAAEIGALCIRLPVDTDWFKRIENDLLEDGALDLENRAWIATVLRQLPLLASKDELRRRCEENRAWYLTQLIEVNGLDPNTATRTVDATLVSPFAGCVTRCCGERRLREQLSRSPGYRCGRWWPTYSPKWRETFI